MSIDVFDFFSGCGGTSCGFKAAGFNIKLGLDIDSSASKTFSENFPEAEVINSDIRALSTDALSTAIGTRKNKILFSGCAPCQPFSKQNRQNKPSDARATLLDEFARFVEHWLPDYVFIENVPGMQNNSRKSAIFNRFLTTLERLNYSYDSEVVEAQWFGVPQKRRRLVLVASLNSPVKIPQRTHGPDLQPYSTVREWIYDLPRINHGQVHQGDPDHFALGLSETNLARIRLTPEGGGRSSWPESLLINCHRNYSGHTDVYGRLSWDKPAVGLTTRCISYSNGRFGHPEQDRAISLREAACLQTFPRDFRFHGTKSSKSLQVGNAVPPLMAKAIAQSFTKTQ